MVDEHIHEFFKGFPRNCSPYGYAGAALSAGYRRSITTALDIDDPDHRKAGRPSSYREDAYARCDGATSMVSASRFMYPQNDMGFAANFLHMMFGTPCEAPNVSPTLAKAMDTIFLLHADHEQNASTSTVRLAGFEWGKPLCLYRFGHCGAVGALSHGGANEAVLEMLYEIGDESNISKSLSCQGEGQGGSLQAYGVRPSGL